MTRGEVKKGMIQIVCPEVYRGVAKTKRTGKEKGRRMH